MKLYYSIN